jgi:hypothetical protein
MLPLVMTNSRDAAARDQENHQHCDCLTHRSHPFFQPIARTLVTGVHSRAKALKQ